MRAGRWESSIACLIAAVALGACGSTKPKESAALPQASAATGAGFSYDMPAERLQIRIPGIPAMALSPHPLREKRADLRYMGGDDASGHTLSIMTPTADAGMTAEQCAASRFRNLQSQYGFGPKVAQAWRNDPTTYVVVFPHREGQIIQFKGYVMSAYGGDHCIDVHVSKIVTERNEDAFVKALLSWTDSFRTASIRSY